MRGAVPLALSSWFVGFPVALALACEPCLRVLDFDESAERADLIIVGRRTDYLSSESEAMPGGPDTVEVKVLRVLKGEVEEEFIRVNSWDGMCDYGIVVDHREHLMLLERRGLLYDAVNSGCSTKSILQNDTRSRL